MTTAMIGSAALIGFVTVLALSGYLAMREACRREKPPVDWLETWTL